MKRCYEALFAVLLLFSSVTSLSAAKVENATAAQTGNRVQFYYDLVGTEEEADVSLTMTIQGKEYRSSDLHLEGDIGRVKTGRGKVIYWDVLRDFPGGIKSNLEWEIVAGGSTTQATQAGSFEEIEFVFVKGGCFSMGDASGIGDGDERPVHEICLGDFYIGKYEVSQGQWREIMGSNPSHFNLGPQYPVENVSWYDVQAFIRKLNEKTGKVFRLPTEAEWEYAATSGGKREVFSGISDERQIYRFGNFCDGYCDYDWKAEGQNDGFRHTAPVGSFQPNGLGVYDMTGNVREWVQDWYQRDYYQKNQKENPAGPASGTYRVLRGGSWTNKPREVRSSSRAGAKPSNRYFNNGFRLAISSPAR